MELIHHYFKGLSRLQLEQFGKLGPIYASWNEKINVISRKDIEHLYERHVLHSLSISKIILFKPGTQILDLGTGGGFPGIPLAILFPDSTFVLVDSIRKKIKVVQDIADQLGLKNVCAIHRHSNELNQKFDFIVSRAVSAFPTFIKLTKGKIKSENNNSLSNGIIYLKGGDLTDEIKDFKNKVFLYPISDFFTEDYFNTKYLLYFPA